MKVGRAVVEFEALIGRHKLSLSPSLVESIADLVEAPSHSTKVVIVLDWGTHEFFATMDYLQTDANGQPILQPIKKESLPSMQSE